MKLFSYLTSIFLITKLKFTKRCLYIICRSSRKFWWVQCADAIAFSESSRVFYLYLFLYITMLRIDQYVLYYTILFTWKFFKNVLNNLARVLDFQQKLHLKYLNWITVLEYLRTCNIFYLTNGSRVTSGIFYWHMFKQDILSYQTT